MRAASADLFDGFNRLKSSVMSFETLLLPAGKSSFLLTLRRQRSRVRTSRSTAGLRRGFQGSAWGLVGVGGGGVTSQRLAAKTLEEQPAI